MRFFVLAVTLCLYTVLAVGQTNSPQAAAPANPNPAPAQGKTSAKTSATPTAKRMAADAQDVGRQFGRANREAAYGSGKPWQLAFERERPDV